MTNYKLSDGRPNGNVAGGVDLEGFIVETKVFKDGTGRTVQQNVVVAGTPPEGFFEFVGVAQARIAVQGAGGPPAESVEEFGFGIEGAKTIVDAFRAFDAFRAQGFVKFREAKERQFEPQVAAAPASALRALGRPHRG